jgi:four helix bundle protein
MALIKHFADLKIWQIARELQKDIYNVVKTLPAEEKFNLGIQLRKAAVSITANIAEGYGRYHYQENIQFCRISRGSAYEIQDHLRTCFDQRYIDHPMYSDLFDKCIALIRGIDGYIRYLDKKKNEN